MNILYVLNSGQPGGMEYHVLDLVRGMSQRGHKVYVWCGHGPMINLYESSGAEVFVKTLHMDISFSFIYSLYCFLKEYKIDVIHAHELRACVNCLIASFFARTKVRVTHTHTPISEWRIPGIKKFVNVKLYTFCVNVFSSMEIALTKSRLTVKLAEGIQPSKLTVIPNGIDTELFNIPDTKKEEYRREMALKYKYPYDGFILGCVSRLTVEKGTQQLLLAFSELIKNERIPKSVMLVLAGGGHLEDAVRNTLRELNIANRVIVTGIFAHTDQVKLYASFDAFVFPSYAEGFGVVLLEAMASKLPIICSDLPVLREVGGDSIFTYFDPHDKLSIEKAITALVSSENVLQFGTYAYERANGLFSLENFVSSYVSLYKKLYAEVA